MYNEAFIQSSKNKTKGIWQVINKETGNFPHNNYNIQLQYNNEAISDPQLISERFNNCFIDTVEDRLKKRGQNSTRIHQKGIKPNSASMFTFPITQTEIKNVISTLKGKNSAGYDEIPETLIKHCSEYIAKPLTHIFNLSVKFGIFPEAMKIAKITPIHKKGDKQDIQNYRPIAVLPVFSKILEKIMYNRLLCFLKKFKILTDEQNGFRDNKSTTTACHIFIEQVQHALDNNLYAIGIFLDLTKAYEVLNHDRLLHKLESYGVRGILNTWFRSYLSGRSQYVSLTQIDKKKGVLYKYSSSLRVNLNGVPQGSILGPLLFLIYINDLPYNLQGTKFVLYADDTNILIVDKEEEMLQQKITSVMKHMEKWFSDSDLIVNIDKTCAISFHHYQNHQPIKPSIKLQNKIIGYKTELKFLGLNVTETLTWQTQIQSLSTSLCKSYYMIKSLKNITSTRMIWNVYFAYVESRLRYGIIFWGGESKSIQIFQLQKKVIRLITGTHKRTSCRPIFRKFKILTLTSLYILEVLCFLKKYKGDIKCNLDIHEPIQGGNKIYTYNNVIPPYIKKCNKYGDKTI